MSDISTFDPTLFMDSTTEDSMSTSSQPCPEGEFPATVKEVKVSSWQSKKDPTLAGIKADVFWSIDDQNVLAALERKEVIVKQGIMLDTTEQGGLDTGKGKNVTLGRLREALNLNQPGRPFSLNQLAGRAAKVAVKHRVDGDQIYADVKAVTALV